MPSSRSKSASRPLSPIVWISLVTAAGAATAESGPPASCYDVTQEGFCQGTVAVYCPDQEGIGPVVEQECAPGTCEYVDDVGYRCVTTVGQACASRYGEPRFCAPESGADTVYACDVAAGCVATTGEHCTQDAGAPDSVCDGDVYIARCLPWHQPLQLDCASLSATCSTAGCVGVAAGERCEPSYASCAEGLGCQPGVHLGSGILHGECRARVCSMLDFERRCVDDSVLAHRCSGFGQPVLVDCAAEGGACADGACVVPNGASCTFGETATNRCQDGSECAEVDGRAQCQQRVTPDVADAGSSSSPVSGDDVSCACAGAAPISPFSCLAWLLPGVIILGRRGPQGRRRVTSSSGRLFSVGTSIA